MTVINITRLPGQEVRHLAELEVKLTWQPERSAEQLHQHKPQTEQVESDNWEKLRPNSRQHLCCLVLS